LEQHFGNAATSPGNPAGRCLLHDERIGHAALIESF
jgi:hypothetical protein